MAFEDLTFEVAAGEVLCVIGPSGCGKTTLLRIIAGLEAVTRGRILQRGRDITRAPPAARDYGIVFQSYALFPNLTVAENVAYGLVNRRAGRAAIAARVQELLALVGLPEAGPKYPSQCSGGQQQRVALARALAAEPKCLLLDEPLSNLDAKLRSQMRTELRQLIKASGTTAIYVTHDQKEAMSMADRVGVMHAGRLAQIAAPRMLYQSPAGGFTAEFVGQANFIKGRVNATSPLQIETAAGLLVSNADSRFQVGAAVVCCVRAEDVMVLPDEDGN